MLGESNERINSIEEMVSKWIEGFEEQLREMFTYSIAGLHMKRTSTDDFRKVSIPFIPFIQNDLTTPHGAIIDLLLDTTIGVLASHTPPEDEAVVSVNYLVTSTKGHIHAHASISYKDRQTSVISENVIDDRVKRLAIATGSFFVIQRRR